MAKARKNQTRGDSGLQVRLNSAERKTIKDLAKRLDISMSEVMRRGLPLLVRQLENVDAGGPAEITMKGDSTTLAWKNEVLRSIREGKGITMAATDAGVTLRTVEYGLVNDEVFEQMAYESKSYWVETVEQTLLHLAKGWKGKRPNVTACLAYLNANHPDYGLMRQQSAERILEPFVEGVLDIAQRLLSPENLDAFTEAVTDHTGKLISEAGTKKR